MPSTRAPAAGTARPAPKVVLVAVGLLVAVVLTFVAIRLAVDVPHLAAGTVPEEDDFERRYVEHPWLAYLHIGPGLLYLLGAPLQLAARVRRKHYVLHRRLGRVLVGAALVTAVFAIAFGVPFAFGGSAEAVATLVFSVWFVVCLVIAVRAIRRRRVAEHRRWMIRAFVTGIAVGSIRVWVGLLSLAGLLEFPDRFGVAFWVAFLTHVAAGEWWVRTRPHPPR